MYGSSVLTTPKFAGQTSPVHLVDGTRYSPTYAEGQEAIDRKMGKYTRNRAGDDDDRY